MDRTLGRVKAEGHIPFKGIRINKTLGLVNAWVGWRGFPGGSEVKKRLPAMRETWVRSLGLEDPLEGEMATHFSIPAWRITWMEEPGGLQSMGLQRVGHDWATSLSLILTSVPKLPVSFLETTYLPSSHLCSFRNWQISCRENLPCNVQVFYPSFLTRLLAP